MGVTGECPAGGIEEHCRLITPAFRAREETVTGFVAEDEVACTLLEKGREALYLSGEEEFGPVDSFLEAGVAGFYEFLTPVE